jgi:hypothetical protein
MEKPPGSYIISTISPGSLSPTVTAPTWPFTEPLDPGGCGITTEPCMY